MNAQINPNQATMLDTFIACTNIFLTRMSNVFDDCPKLRAKKDEFERLVVPNDTMKKIVCALYHKEMSPYYDACNNKNPAPFLEEKIQFLKDIGFKEKYTELLDEEVYTKEMIDTNIKNVWDYVNEMNRYALLYNTVPKGIMSKVESTAQNAMQDVLSGKKSFRDIQSNFIQMGKDVFNGAEEDDMDELLENFQSIISGMGGIKKLREVATQMKIDPSTIANMAPQ